MKQSKVFIPNKSTHDYSAAEEFGELVYLSKGNLDRYKTSKVFRLFISQLMDSEPEDFLLVSGLPMLNIVACFILTQLHGRVNLLLFKAGKGGKKSYVERVLK